MFAIAGVVSSFSESRRAKAEFEGRVKQLEAENREMQAENREMQAKNREMQAKQQATDADVQLLMADGVAMKQFMEELRKGRGL